MALTGTKIVNLTAESTIDDTVVARFSATVNSNTDVNSGYSEQILDASVYSLNKVAVRADMAEFRTLIYALEDEMAADEV